MTRDNCFTQFHIPDLKDATTLRTRKVQKDTKLSAKDAKKSISATYGKDPIDEIER